MAEFCLECWNNINNIKDSKWRYAGSWGKELCEECGQYKRVVVVERLWSRTQRTLTEVIENRRKNLKNLNPQQYFKFIPEGDALTYSLFTKIDPRF